MIWVLVAFCWIISFLFSGIEAGLLALNPVRLRHRAKSGDHGARRLQKMLKQPERLLITVLLVTNAADIIALIILTHELVIRWARSQQWPPAHMYHRSWHGWHVSDDAETSYTPVGASGGGNPERGYRGGTAFEPSPPPTATSLRITHETVDDVLSVALTD